MADKLISKLTGQIVVQDKKTVAALDTAISVTGFGIVSNQFLYSRQDKDRMIVTGTFDYGTRTSGLKINLGGGRTVRAASNPTGANRVVVGKWIRMTNTSVAISSSDNEGPIFYDGSDATALYFAVSTASYQLVKSDVFSANNERLYIEFDISETTYHDTQTVVYGAGLAGPTTPGISSGNLGWAGSTSGTAIPTGKIGERVVNQQTSFIALPSSNTYGGDHGISLTAGEWDITAQVSFQQNGATVTYCDFFIGTVVGNNTTGRILGDNFGEVPGTPTSNFNVMGTVANYSVRPTSTTTYYLKVRSGYSGAQANYLYRFSARRVG